MEPHIRDEVIDFINKWLGNSHMNKNQIIKWIGIGRSKYFSWCERYGKDNCHNGKIPRDYWLLEEEKETIIKYYLSHSQEGYRAITYRMIDEDVIAVSPATTYRVLKKARLFSRWNNRVSSKGRGFKQPLEPHEHWHTDVSYININGTFYYFIGVLDGCSRYLINWDIRESMKEVDVEIVLQKAIEKYPEAKPTIISDNGSAYVSKEFKKFIKLSGMTHVRTSPFYPQSNGKMERFNQTLKKEAIRPKTPLSLQEAKKLTQEYVNEYNNYRLHSSIGFVTPKDRLEGRHTEIYKNRDNKLEEARRRRKLSREKATPQNVCKSYQQPDSLALAFNC